MIIDAHVTSQNMYATKCLSWSHFFIDKNKDRVKKNKSQSFNLLEVLFYFTFLVSAEK